MAKLVYGERIARQGAVLLGCSAVVFDNDRQEILLTRRTDNGRWCLPGGALDPGETVIESCEREVREETGLDVEVVRLVGVYSDPHRLIEYADGNRFHVISLNFETKVIGGELIHNEETSEFLWVSPEEVSQVDLMEHHLERIADAIEVDGSTVVK